MEHHPDLVTERIARIWSIVIGGAFAMGMLLALVALLLTGCSTETHTELMEDAWDQQPGFERVDLG